MRRYTERRRDDFRRSQDDSQSDGKVIVWSHMFLCPRRLKVNKGEKYNHPRPLNYHNISTIIIKFTCTNLRNVHTPCKVQRWRSAESASSGLFELSATSVHCLLDNLHVHVFPKMLRILALDHNGRFVCSVSPPCVLLSLQKLI